MILIREGYAGGPQNMRPSSLLTVRPYTPQLAPWYWVWDDGGYQVCLINGTTNIAVEGPMQMFGWVLNYDRVDQGGRWIANAHYDDAGEACADSCGLVPTLFIGHSMGGAVAEMAAVKHQLANVPSMALSFGSPRPMANDLLQSERYHSDSIVSLVNEFDAIPLLPQAERISPVFYHPGRYYVIDDRGNLHEADQPGESSGVVIGERFASNYGEHYTSRYFHLMRIHVDPAWGLVGLTDYQDP